jgi:hypothetical protein
MPMQGVFDAPSEAPPYTGVRCYFIADGVEDSYKDDWLKLPTLISSFKLNVHYHIK